MGRSISIVWGWLAGALCLFAACEPEDISTNTPPETQLFIDSIGLPDTTRLSTTVQLHWSGSDADGYIDHYEILYGESPIGNPSAADGWQSVGTTRDSSFLFNITSREADLYFYVRAVDNKSTADPQPASITLPLVNTPPEAHFLSEVMGNDSILGPITLPISVSDADGRNNIDSIFLQVNDGPLYALGPRDTVVTLLPEEGILRNGGTGQAKVFSGLIVNQDDELEQKSRRISGIEVGGQNTFRIKVRDLAGEESPFDTLRILEDDSSFSTDFYMRPVAHPQRLVINSFASDADRKTEYNQLIAQTGGEFDFLDFEAADKGNQQPPTYISTTHGLLFNLYEEIVWYSDWKSRQRQDPIFPLSTLGNTVEAYSGALRRFLESNNKLFLILELPEGRQPNDNEQTREGFIGKSSPLFSFIPADSVPSPPYDSVSTNGRLPRVGTGDTVHSIEPGFPSLVSTTFKTHTPLYLKFAADSILVNRQGDNWTEPDARYLAAKLNNAAGNTNQVFVSTDLMTLGEDPGALREFFRAVFEQEFNW